jgi:outer membrane protein assembly factor BamC
MINRNNLLTNSLSKLFCLLAVAGCASTGGNILEGERIDYQSATKATPGATLEVPPDLSQISRDNRYAIPNSSNAPLTASDFNAKASSASAPAPTTALNFSQDMRIERDGTQRWLLVKQSPEALWPKVKEFWQENGFLIIQESETTGVMETDWAENRAKIPDDFLRSAIGFVFDSLYSTGERDKFRTRLERRPDGSTEIYISHRGLEEVLVGAQKSTATWVNRPNDPALEVTFLTRLMVSLGATQEKAKELVAAPIAQPARAKLINNGSVSMVDVNEGFDRTWRRVGLALDRVGFTVEDRDRIKGIYFVRYVDEETDTNKDGLFTRLFSSNDKQANAKRYQISVKGEGSLSQVAVLNNEGGAEKTATADKILHLLLEQLK